MHQSTKLNTLLLGGSSASVDELGAVVDDALDETLLLEVRNGAAGERTVDLHAVNEGRLGDDLVGGDLLHDAVAEQSQRSVQYHCVAGQYLHYSQLEHGWV